MITKGDIVRVTFYNANITLARKAEVLHVPQKAGESWIIKDTEDNNIHYINEGCTITKTNK